MFILCWFVHDLIVFNCYAGCGLRCLHSIVFVVWLAWLCLFYIFVFRLH